MNESIAKTLAVLPDKSGVYIMRDEHGKIIYVGKAVVLKNRVRSYFRNLASHTVKVKALVAKVAEIETIVTDSEVEALILECNLIKKNMPKFNVLLKDDKTYPYIKINVRADYPEVYITRRIINDGSKYFGPYANSGSAKAMIDCFLTFVAKKFNNSISSFSLLQPLKIKGLLKLFKTSVDFFTYSNCLSKSFNVKLNFIEIKSA